MSLATAPKVENTIIADRRSNWTFVVLLFATVAVATALSLHAAGHLAQRAEALALAGQHIRPSALLSALNAVDAVLLALSVAGCAVLVWREWRARDASRFISTATPWQYLVVLVILLAWLGQCYLFPGVLLGGDTGTHIARFLEVRRAFTAGMFPGWTNFEYLGSPLLGFTGPLTYVVGGALDVLIRDPVVTAKTVLFTLQIASGLAFYWLLRRLAFRPIVALTAALGFAGCFASLHLFLYRGTYPVAFTILFFVALFAAAEGLMRSARCRALDWLVFCGATAGLIINHQPHALFAAFYFLIYGAGRIGRRQWQVRALPRVITAGLVGVGMSLCAVIPVIAEADWVMIVPGNAVFHIGTPTPHRLLDLILWRNTRTTWGIDYWAYLGITIVVLAGIGTWAALTGRSAEDRRGLVESVLPCLFFCLFLYNPVVRDVIFIIFFVGILAACGMEYLATKAQPTGRLLLIVCVAVLVDLSSTAIQPVARTDKQFLVDEGRYLEQAAPNQRMVQMHVVGNTVEADIGPDAGPMSAYATVQRVAGTHNMAATRVHNYAETAVELAAQDLQHDDTLSEVSIELLSLLNAARVVCDTPVGNGCPDRFYTATPEGPLGRVIHVGSASPVWFSRSVTLLTPAPRLDKPMIWQHDWTDQSRQIQAIEAFIDRYLKTAQIDIDSHQATTLPVRSLPTLPGAAPGEDSAWHPRLLRYQVSEQTVRLAIESDRAGYVQLAHPWFPGLRVTVNGVAVQPLRGSLDLMVLPLAAGTSDIAIQPFTTRVRAVSDLASGGFLAVALVVGAVLARPSARRR